MVPLCILVFGYAQLTAAVKLVATQPYNGKWFLLKTANTSVFSTKYFLTQVFFVNLQETFLSAAGHTSKLGPSRKPKTL